MTTQTNENQTTEVSTQVVNQDTTEVVTGTVLDTNLPVSLELEANSALEKLLNVITFLTIEEWDKIFEHYNKNSNIKLTSSFKLKIYKVASVDFLIEIATKYNWRIAHNDNKIFIYNGSYWIKVENSMIISFLSKICINMGIPEWVVTSTFAKNVKEQLMTKGFFTKMQTFDKTFLNVQNGIVQIDSNGIKLIPHNETYFLTHLLDFNYETTAKNDLWLKFLDEVLPDKDTQKTLQQALGYLFTRDLKLEKAIFLYGTGSNGKSVIFEIIKGLIGNELLSTATLSQLTNHLGYHLEKINNKLINYGSDVSLSKIDAGIFKSIVSGEPQEVRQIREPVYTMRTYAKFIFNVNKISNADIENTHGFFRRMIFIPFEVTIEEQDKDIHKKILKDKAGVLNWILDGINEVIKNQKIYESEKCTNFLDIFKKESNAVNVFLEESKIIKSTETENKTMNQQDLYEKYVDFCKKTGEKPLTRIKFKGELIGLGFEFKKRNIGQVCFAKISSEVQETDSTKSVFLSKNDNPTTKVVQEKSPTLLQKIFKSA